MRIFVVETDCTGGLIHFAYQLCSALAAAGAEVTLITGTDYELAALPHNFTVERRLRLWASIDPAAGQGRRGHRLRRRLRRAGRAVAFVREWLKLTLYLARARPDIVQFGVIHFPFQAVFLAWLRRRGLRLAEICHEWEAREQAPSLAARLNRALSRVLWRSFDVIFFLAEDTRRQFLRAFPVPAQRTRVIPHGSQSLFAEPGGGAGGGGEGGGAEGDLRARYGLAAGDTAILFFGTIRPSKGVADLIDAFASLRDRGGGRLIIAGYPTNRVSMDDLRERARRCGVADRVVFDTRYVPMEEVGALMALASVVVFPYRSATQSGALQVAYTFGRPVVATRVGGLAEDVEDGGTGLLVPPGDPAALGDALRSLLDDPERARRMGERAGERSRTLHSWDEVARRILAAYRQPALRPGAGGRASPVSIPRLPEPERE